MTDLPQFSAFIALWIGGLALFTFLFVRLEGRIDRRCDLLEADIKELRHDLKGLRHDLAEEFRAQRAEVSAQVAAIAAAINASRER